MVVSTGAAGAAQEACYADVDEAHETSVPKEECFMITFRSPASVSEESQELIHLQVPHRRCMRFCRLNKPNQDLSEGNQDVEQPAPRELEAPKRDRALTQSLFQERIRMVTIPMRGFFQITGPVEVPLCRVAYDLGSRFWSFLSRPEALQLKLRFAKEVSWGPYKWEFEKARVAY